MKAKGAWIVGVVLSGWCHAALAQNVPEEWEACEKDSQCTAVKSICGETWLPVSKPHAEALEEFVAGMRRAANCAPAKAPAAPNMKCMNSRCADDLGLDGTVPTVRPAATQ